MPKNLWFLICIGFQFIPLNYIYSESSNDGIYRELESYVANEKSFYTYISETISFNSDFPMNSNQDGSLWQGKGINAILNIGASWRNDWLSIQIAPDLWFSENLIYDYRLGTLPFGDYSWGLDRLQRYGNSFWWEAAPGQSKIRLRQWGFTLGLGTNNVSLGPAIKQNLLLSAEASGFPMIDLGTDGPLATDWGIFDARIFWGQTSQSAFFDSNPLNDTRLFTGGAFAYSPPFLQDMSFGFIRVFHSPWQTIDAWKIFQLFVDSVWKIDRGQFTGGPGFEDDVDQGISFTFDWNLAYYKARFYAEIARNDHAANLMDFLMQPDHSLGWTIGLQKDFSIGFVDGFQVNIELADTAINMGTVIRPTGSWYRHGPVNGGWTNNGQIMGAPMGPGSNFQGLYLSHSSEVYFLEAGVERLNNDTDYFYSLVDWATWPHYKYNLMMNYLMSASIKLEDWDANFSFKYTVNWNHNFNFDDERSNFHFELSSCYRPPLGAK